jgi:hypothetical protein
VHAKLADKLVAARLDYRESGVGKNWFRVGAESVELLAGGLAAQATDAALDVDE